ncbi:MAG: 2-phospho-L-lactate guanylyltransferase [Gordonia sp. (in: high G+C Gram-positive bacteria)]
MPLKDLSRAKTRLSPNVSYRRNAALAFALDVIGSLRRCVTVGEVVLVTGDPHLCTLAGSGVRVVDDPGRGLNSAIDHAAARLVRDRRTNGRLAVMLADLPAARSADIGEALGTAETLGAVFVPDRQRLGTTFVAVRDGGRLRTSFGAGSAGRHAALGLTPLSGAPARLRADVDTPADLDHVCTTHRVGPATARFLAGARRSACHIGGTEARGTNA